ncbi:MAG: hypothetical protein JSU68_11410 [Phycisphaerales bacterium]|nr:MAG: hypothetical protein JSU68_11410 [Phycisphaerales bacterium]
MSDVREVFSRTHGRNGFRFHRPMVLIACLSLGLAVSGLMQGCIAAATIATIKVISNAAGGHTATVELDVAAGDVYDAMLRILERRPDITVRKQDDKKRQIEATKDKSRMSAQVRTARGGKTELTVSASSGEKTRTDEELAEVIVETICDELGVKWKVVKGKIGEKQAE